jgi:hypothetical protein
MAHNIKVNQEFRKNALSLKPGGSTVTVVYDNNIELEYNNIKNPQAYINTITKSNKTIIGIKINGQLVK